MEDKNPNARGACIEYPDGKRIIFGSVIGAFRYLGYKTYVAGYINKPIKTKGYCVIKYID